MLTFTTASYLRGPSVGGPTQAMAYVIARTGKPIDDFTSAYILELYELCVSIGLRFELAFAQWCDETDLGRSSLWRLAHNPAGIGKFPDGTYVGYVYTTPRDSALAHLVHLWLYASGPKLPEVLAGSVGLDPRWAAAQKNAGVATTLAGLAGPDRWATNPSYAQQIAAHANAAFGGLGDETMALTFGRVPMPAYVDDYIPDFSGQAAGYVGKRFLYGVVWHRMVGSLTGTRQHFRQPGTGLTDYGIGVGGHDAASLDGVIYRWNNPLGKRSGWANGRVIAPWGDGKAFLAEYQPIYGVDIVNRGQVSIEISGLYGTPLTTKARAAIVALTAYYADQAKIPWQTFPEWPGHGYSFVRWHQEFTGPAEKVCPGSVVIAETATLIEATRQRMRQYQEGVQPEPAPLFATPIRPDWLLADVARGVMRDHEYNGITVYGAERVYTALRDTPRRQVASLSGPIVGPPIKKGERFTGSHTFGNWVLTPAGTRVYAPDLTPAVTIRPRQ